MDLAKAFDNANHRILLYRLKQYGIRENTLNLIKSYLNKRRQIVQGDNSASSLLDINIGVLHGSVLGPLLVGIYTNDLVFCSDFNVSL